MRQRVQAATTFSPEIRDLNRQLTAAREQPERLRLLLELTQRLYHPDKLAAGRCALQAVRIAHELGDLPRLARASNLLADILRMRGRLVRALRYSTIGLDAARKSGDRAAEADSLNDQGLIHWHRGEFDRAVALFRDSLSLGEKIGNPRLQSRALANLSLVCWEQGDLVQAMEYGQCSLEIKRHAGDRYGIGIANLNLGLIQGDLGDWEKAVECYYRALVELEKHGDLIDVALCYSNLGEIYLRRNRLDKAIDLFKQSISRAEEAPSTWVKAEALGNLGECFARQGDYLRARDCYEQDIKLSLEMDDKEEMAETWRRVAELHLSLNELPEAATALDHAQRLAERTGVRKEAGNIRRVRGCLLAAEGKPESARAVFEEGRAILTRFAGSFDQGRLLLEYGQRLSEQPPSKAEGMSLLCQAREVFQRLGAMRELADTEAAIARNDSKSGADLESIQELEAIAGRSRTRSELGAAVIECLQRAWQAEAVALGLYSGAVFRKGEVSSDELEILGQARSLRIVDRGARAQGNGVRGTGSVFVPIVCGGNQQGAMFLRWSDADRPAREAGLLTAAAGVIGLGLERTMAQTEVEPGPSKGESSPALPTIVGADTSLHDVMVLIQRAAPTRVSVMIRGESGTGKELIARAVHAMSDRVGRPFVAINCAAIPETLLESELFGIEKGTATGVSARIGKLETATGGTVFLDEIGDMSLSLQAKLLRLLQERQLERVGGRQTIDVDLRVIAATSRDLEAGIADGTFRKDLYYRLNVVPVVLPALRERRADIPLLANHFLGRYRREFNRKLRGISDEAMNRLLASDWPGNVRELENAIERAVVLAQGDLIAVEDLPSVLQAEGQKVADLRKARAQVRGEGASAEKGIVAQILARFDWNMTRAAAELGISRRHLYRLISKYGIEKPPTASG